MKSQTIKWLNEQITDETPKKELDLIQFAIKCVRDFKVVEKNTENESYILELFEKFYKIYIRKGAKVQAHKTFRKKLIKLKTKEEILAKARRICTAYYVDANRWQELGTEKQYIPLCSSWLNKNVPD